MLVSTGSDMMDGDSVQSAGVVRMDVGWRASAESVVMATAALVISSVGLVDSGDVKPAVVSYLLVLGASEVICPITCCFIFTCARGI